MAFVSHGARIGVRVSDPGVLDAVVARLPPGCRAVRSSAAEVLYSVHSGEQHELYRGERRVASAPTLDRLLAVLESELHFAVASHARPHLFVHAGAVAWRGRGVLVPGRSRSGKSELTAALVAAGATYYSDEYAVLDAAGRLHPYAKQPGLRRPGQEKMRLELPGRVGTGPVPVGVIAATHYEVGAVWRPRRLTGGEAMMVLLDNTVLARARPRTALETLARAATGVAALEGRRGEAAEMADRVLACCDGGR